MDVARAISNVRKYVSGMSYSGDAAIVGRAGDLELRRFGDRARVYEAEMGNQS